jgi:N-acetyl-anhydromuramyl-L-alanine amidase AmpD
MYLINNVTYDKTKAIPYDPERECGYQPRPTGRLAPRSIIIHTTNGKKGTTFDSEARYIRNSRVISAHYLIGKDGRIVQFLDPRYWIAYHAGCVKATLWSNVYSIGIEMHNTPAEGHISNAMMDALDWLVRDLMFDYNIPSKSIDTHRNVAVFCKNQRNAGKLGRKIDPSGLPNNEFYAWRNTLAPSRPNVQKYRVINAKGVNVRQSPQVNDHNIAGVLYYNDVFESDSIKTDELGQTHTGASGSSNQWAHIYKGMSQGKSVDQLGFVSLSNLRRE